MSTFERPERSRTFFQHLLHPVRLREVVSEWLKEDTPGFDYGGFVVGEKIEEAVLLCKGEGVLAGSPFFDEVFRLLNCTVEWHAAEGDDLKPYTDVAIVTGKVRHILLGERVALNCIARASGIACYGRYLRNMVKNYKIKETGSCWHGEIAGTRKTTPGFRMVEKYALLVGGLATHRYDLSSMIMLKDNHIWSAGSITQVVNDARSVGGFSSKIEVECRSLAEGLEASKAGCDVIMLDNFSPQLLHETAGSIKKQYPKMIIEASGGIDENNIIHFVGEFIDVISLSRTTQGYGVIDFSLKIRNNHHS